MKKFLHNVAERIKSMREGRRDTEYQILCEGSEVRVSWLTVENTQGAVSFSWDIVQAVDTFKRDLFTVDCICLAFETAEGWIEVNEDMKGWRDLLAGAESSLPKFPPVLVWQGDASTFRNKSCAPVGKRTGSAEPCHWSQQPITRSVPLCGLHPLPAVAQLGSPNTL